VQRGWLATTWLGSFSSWVRYFSCGAPGGGLAVLRGLKCQVVRADITNPEQIKEALKGAEAVVHAAGLVSITEASKISWKLSTWKVPKTSLKRAKQTGLRS